ncbi:MAG: threonylcarbamoyl-AMP synthase [Candidatus Riflebacteria bacterium]|nr:threonylcarbamoyl-AMP synthase [Candidatus Riflebacteria bacterium]
MPRILEFTSSPERTAAHGEKLELLAAVLEAGGVVALPTDTVWGVAAMARNREALSRVFELKGREPDKPLPIFVADTRAARDIFLEFPPAFERLAAAFWPGALTLVGAPAGDLPSEVRAADGTVAVRVPSVRLLQQLLSRLGHPLACTSANRSGSPPLVDLAAVERELGHGLALLVATEEPSGGTPSTVVALQAGVPRVLRAGAISEEAILAAVA